ncbi:thiamine pyrophosphate-dependent enzyme [Niabella hibiscisoli]|uniref:thiamine pyrophosphate-dependent enzyme n=1 Tax=Niabella hibiscisoli TaxID=1825928 RepID=UPI001F10673D|nr:thiamine pyrophosphate-dependent enzyme [Niabella hibiscisoli]MCH5715987.1 thiamine pyrophosphate-dependent enzyme [Niabella hibiscisoli]
MGEKDPVNNFEQYLIQEEVLTENDGNAIRDELKAKVEDELKQADAKAFPLAVHTSVEINDVYAPMSRRKN